MNLQRYFIRLSYKGTHFFGWQIQPNAITVQETIGNALTKINRGILVKITGCGRTDTGVHASDFFAHIDFDTDLDEKTLAHKLNCMIGNDIAIKGVQKVLPDVHSRFSATSRTYHYFINQHKDPFLNETSWFLKQDLDIDKMNRCCDKLLKHTYFKCFSKAITGITNYECTVAKAEWIKTEKGYQFTIQANRFLRNMVRAIVGTMIEIGTNKLTESEFDDILQSGDRKEAGKSAPAQGLFLAEIRYDNNPEVTV